MDILGFKMNSTLILILLACIMICIQAAPHPETSQESQPKKPSIPGIGINTGFDEIKVESNLRVLNKNPEKRQSKNKTPRLIIPHMIPKKFGEADAVKYAHTDDPAEKTSTTIKLPKSKKSNTTSTTTEKNEDAEK